MTTPTHYVTLAAIYALRNVSGALPTTREDFSQIVEDRYKWKITPETIDKIVRQLRAWGFATVIEDKYAGEMLRLYRARTNDALEELNDSELKPLIANASTGGVEWFVKVFSNKDFWHDLHNDPLPADTDKTQVEDADENSDVPASDRIVTRSDNRAVVELIEADVRGLNDEISTSNEVGDALGEGRDVIVGELKAAETLLEQPAFRFARLFTLVMPALRFLAEKFAAGAIGEMAKRLINAILGLA